MTRKYIIGIDPDADKSGYGVVDTECGEVVEAGALPFPELIRKVGGYGGMATVVIEGGWLNKSNWHLGNHVGARKAAAIGRSVGMNHLTGILVSEMLKSMGVSCKVVKPLGKCWRGKDGKITREELAYVSAYDKRTSQDVRDGILLAWVYAGLPIRVKPTGGKRGGL